MSSNPLASEQVIVSAPFSFIGSAQRIWKMTRVNNVVVKLFLIPFAVMLVFGAWIFVACWYGLMYILFGIFFIPWRLWRRGSRKNRRDKLRHREVLDTINRQRRP